MEDLRMQIKMKGYTMWKIAEVIGVSEMTLYRWFRKYNSDHYNSILSAIKKIEEGETK